MVKTAIQIFMVANILLGILLGYTGYTSWRLAKTLDYAPHERAVEVLRSKGPSASNYEFALNQMESWVAQLQAMTSVLALRASVFALVGIFLLAEAGMLFIAYREGRILRRKER